MKTAIATLAVLAALTGAAWSSGSHEGGHHDGGSEAMAIGKPGDPSAVVSTRTVAMLELDDGGMAFEPASITVKEGETVRIELTNKGKLEHEFVMNTHDEIMEHKAEMEKSSGMMHDDPNALRLAPGETGEIVWQFTRAGTFGFACLIPGHYELGMKGTIEVES